ncbi:MAG: prepilin-type N-terminal cleavage/methylation domain-containing protein [Spirirestis rafaelensis WJT71-NPBG6]|jgi:type IV pilus assembly protein PilA|nr:prepilin-type N-terminal cleavage/methylation domain-containing protein [Spirirestis rafaelensis WJT71-NPBG6]
MLKPELQAKFLQNLNRKKKGDEGFTLIELLVVVIIIGVLAAIALPSLLGQVSKAKQAEAKQNLGTLNRSQQAFFLEYQNFASTVSQLQVGIKSQTDNYTYEMTGGGTAATVQNKAQAGKQALKSYYGVVGTAVGDVATSEALTLAIACEAPAPGTSAIQPSTSFTNCENDYKSLAR